MSLFILIHHLLFIYRNEATILRHDVNISVYANKETDKHHVYSEVIYSFIPTE